MAASLGRLQRPSPNYRRGLTERGLYISCHRDTSVTHQRVTKWWSASVPVSVIPIACNDIPRSLVRGEPRWPVSGLQTGLHHPPPPGTRPGSPGGTRRVARAANVGHGVQVFTPGDAALAAIGSRPMYLLWCRSGFPDA